MELQEQDDPKVELLNKSAKYLRELEDEVKVMSDHTERIITNALMIGGTLALTYFVLRQFTASRRKKKRSERIRIVQAQADGSEISPQEDSAGSGIMAQIGTTLATQAAAFLLDIARQKLSEYIEEKLAEKGEDDERS